MFKESQLPYCFSARDLAKGYVYFQSGRVHRYEEMRNGDQFEISCVVQGSSQYYVSIEHDPESFIIGLKMHCTCPRFRDVGVCKHLAAAMLQHFALIKNPNGYPQCEVSAVSRSNRAALRLLDAMRDTGKADAPSTVSQADAPPEALARVIPVLTVPDSYERCFQLGLKVGYEKPYVVRNISEFLSRVDRRETYQYGKQLTLNHAPENFDEDSQRLIGIVRQIGLPYLMGKNQAMNRWGNADQTLGQHLPLTIEMLLSAFDLFSKLPLVDSGGRPMRLTKGSPAVTAAFTRQDGMICLKVKTGDGWKPGGDDARVWVRNGEIMLCDERFARNVAPLLLGDKSGFCFVYDDMPAFCSLVLPRIRDHVDIVDPEGILDEYMPDECTPRFYFDQINDSLVCRLTFHYDDRDIPFGNPAETGRRDLAAEDAAVRLLRRDFDYRDSASRFVMDGETRMLDFLSSGIDAYREAGEVFVSERLKRREVASPRASVGVSVSDGMLSLSLDLGGFPPEELEALYQSLLTRQRYHRLGDGRVMRLANDGSGIEAVAETAHMTQLSGSELKDGAVRLPAYRALYLDGALDRREGLRVRRDEAFKALIRRFKTVEDSDYRLPEGIHGELRPYQETGYRWLKTLESCHFGGILADEMGLGKTLQMIVFFASKPRSDTGLSHLVACPASLVLNWQDELARFAPDLKVRVISGPLKVRKEMLSEAGGEDVWVTSYDLLKRDIALYDGREFYSFVLDEGQFVKNQSTKASKAVKQINCRQRFVLTGTPVENRLSELWNLFDFLMPGYLFSHQRFVERLEKPIIQKGSAEARQQLNRLVRPFILRRLKKDVLKELPDKLEYVRRIPLSEDERRVYHAQSLAALSQLSGTHEKLAILAALTRLRQICCDPGLCFENYEGETSKLEACLELIRSMTENGHQILLFSQFTSMLEIIRGRLDEEHISSFTLRGSTPKEERARLVKAFNQGGAQVFLISLKAGGTGLNLTAADVVIHYDPWWNMAAQNQATDRAHRIGQQNCVQVYRLIAGDTVEERILELQNKKAALMDAITENAGEDILRMSQEDLLALIKDD